MTAAPPPAVTLPGGPWTGVAPLMRRAFAGEDLTPLAELLLARARDRTLAPAECMDLATVLQLTGHRNEALAVQREAVVQQARYTLPAHYTFPGFRLLVLMTPGDIAANTAIELLVTQTDVTLDLLYLRADAALPDEVPDHDALIVAVGATPEHEALLKRLGGYLWGWPRPVINRPEHLRLLAGGGLGEALAGVAGLSLAPAPADWKSADGQYRKYRIALIDGRPYLTQFAMGPQPALQFLGGAVTGSAGQRGAEAGCFEGFERDFAQRHSAAFAAIHKRLHLPYVCLDCADTPSGQLLLCAANNTTLVHALDPPDLFAYKAPAMRKLFSAFRDMLGRAPRG